MMGDDGRIRVLDFGLAKPAGGFAVESEGPTAAKTNEGVIVGTVNYMSPEQAQGQPVDTRSDIFSLGIIFYEMIAGRRPFGGDNPASVLSSIIKDDPQSLAELARELPRDLVKIVRRCLVKDPTRRFQSAIDLRNDLDELEGELSSGELQDVSVHSRRVRSQKPLVVIGLMLVAAVGGYFISSRNPADSRSPVARLANPVQLTSAAGLETNPAWLPTDSCLPTSRERVASRILVCLRSLAVFRLTALPTTLALIDILVGRLMGEILCSGRRGTEADSTSCPRSVACRGR